MTDELLNGGDLSKPPAVGRGRRREAIWWRPDDVGLARRWLLATCRDPADAGQATVVPPVEFPMPVRPSAAPSSTRRPMRRSPTRSVTLVEVNLTVKHVAGRPIRIRAGRAADLHADRLDHRLHLRAPAAWTRPPSRLALWRASPVIDITVPLAEGTGTYQEAVNGGRRATTRPKALGVSSQMELGSAGLADCGAWRPTIPMRAVQALPGVATGDDFQAEFSVRGSAFRHVGIVIDGTPTQLLMHSIRSANDSGSIAMINTRHPEPRRALWRPAPAAARRLARRHARVRRPRRHPRPRRTAGGGQRHQRLGRLRGTASAASTSRVVARVAAQELPRLADPQDRPGRRQHHRLQRRPVEVRLRLHPAPAGAVLQRAGRCDVSRRRRRPRQRHSHGAVAQRAGVARLALRTSRAILTQRLSFIGNISEQRGVVGQHLADGRTDSFSWRADLVVPLASPGRPKAARVWKRQTHPRRCATSSPPARRPCACASSDRRRRHR